MVLPPWHESPWSQSDVRLIRHSCMHSPLGIEHTKPPAQSPIFEQGAPSSPGPGPTPLGVPSTPTKAQDTPAGPAPTSSRVQLVAGQQTGIAGALLPESRLSAQVVGRQKVSSGQSSIAPQQ